MQRPSGGGRARLCSWNRRRTFRTRREANTQLYQRRGEGRRHGVTLPARGGRDERADSRPCVLQPEHVTVTIPLGATPFLVEIVPPHVGKDQLLGEVLHRDDGWPGGHHPLRAVALRRAVERG